jgi:antitoxin component of MazEF toxin-antitoxin module
MAAVEYGRRTVRLRRTGGSRAVVLPQQWLEQLGVGEHVDLVQTDDGIVVQAPRPEPSIEDEPEFAQFLAFLARDALARPDRLGDVGELTTGAAELFRDVPVD